MTSKQVDDRNAPPKAVFTSVGSLLLLLEFG